MKEKKENRDSKSSRGQLNPKIILKKINFSTITPCYSPSKREFRLRLKTAILILVCLMISGTLADDIDKLLHDKKDAKLDFKHNLGNKLDKLMSLNKEVLRKKMEAKKLKVILDPIEKLQSWTKSFVTKIRDENFEMIHELTDPAYKAKKDKEREEKKKLKAEEERKKRLQKIIITPVSVIVRLPGHQNPLNHPNLLRFFQN